jgi:hypothetical protein
MFKSRFLVLLGLLSLLLVAMSVLEEAQRTQQSWAADTARWEAMGEYYANQADAQHEETPLDIMDSATRSYIAWGQAMQVRNAIDSATRSYIAWGEALEKAKLNALDSGTRSYIARGKALEAAGKLVTRAPASYRPPLDECYDVSLSELAACREASTLPSP